MFGLIGKGKRRALLGGASKSERPAQAAMAAPKKQPRIWALSLFWGISVAMLLLATAGDYGLTYDEPVYASRAMRAAEWLELLFAAPQLALSRSTIDRLWDPTGDEQAGLLKLLAWPAARLTAPFISPLAALRTATALIAGLFFALFFAFLASARGRLEASFACLGLLTMPRLFAHWHLLTMDAPVMAFSFLSVAAAYWAAWHGEKQRQRCWLWIAFSGLCFGLAISCKANGWLTPLILLPWLLWIRQRRVFWAALVSLAILGPLVFVGTWPWLWHDTGVRLARYFRFFGQHYPVGVLYWGRVYGVAPWHYALVMIAITTPPLLLCLAVLNVFRVARCREDEKQGADGGEPLLSAQRAKAFWGLMAWAFLVHLAPWLVPSTPKYNGVRLFLPVFPPLAVLAAGGFAWIARVLARRVARERREQRALLALLLVVALAPQIWATACFHPFGLSYYNGMIGGLPGAWQRGFEPTYWGEAYYAAVPWLNNYAPRGAKIWINVPGFVSSMRIYQQFGLLRADLALMGGDEAFGQADLYVVMNKPTEYGRLGKELVQRGKMLYAKEIAGVPLVWIFEALAAHEPGKRRGA